MRRLRAWWSRRCRNCGGWGYVMIAWPCPDCRGRGFYPKNPGWQVLDAINAARARLRQQARHPQGQEEEHE